MPSPDATTASGTARKNPFDDDWDFFGLTHAGKIRKTNQDHFLICSLRKNMEVHLTSLPDLDKLPLEGERLISLAMVAD